MEASIRQVILDNGLRVILREVHTAPVTSTWLWYRVGSRNELGADTGISHWVEHMMFKGSRQFPKGEIMHAIDRLGGYVNAMTSNDFTAYYTTLPSERADLALEIEADRMASALFDPDEVEAERTVIIAEREGGENEPGYVLSEEMGAAAFRVHPYHHETIGWKEDLLHLTREALYSHYRTYYVPSNAVLVVVGDFETEDWLRRIERTLGAIVPGTAPQPHIPAEPPQRGERRVTLRMPGAAPIVRLAYHAPATAHPDFMPLVIADAVLSGGKALFAFGDAHTRSARLYRALVETELASSVGSHYHPSLDPYLMNLGATVRQGREPAAVEAALLAEVERLRATPVEPRELQVAIRQAQAQYAYSNESVTSQALTLGFLEIVDHHERMQTLFEEMAAVTPEDVQRVARTYLTDENRVTGLFSPSEVAGQGQDEEGEVEHWRHPQERLCFHHRPARGATISPETVVRARLDNGITVLIRENPASATVAIGGSLRAGAYYDQAETSGLASLTATMLRRGTQRHTFQELNVALDDVGASLDAVAERDDVGIGGQALAADTEMLCNLLTELLVMPTFPEQELNKLRGQFLTHLAVLEMDTGFRSECAFREALYPAGHPYARTVIGTREAMRAFTREQLEQFYRAHYHPETLILSIVGAVQPDELLRHLNGTLGAWRNASPIPGWQAIPAIAPERPITRRVPIPGRPQIDLTLGAVGMPRSSPDYYAAAMANIILGRLGLMGRLGETVRDEQGLAYYVSSSLRASQGYRPWMVEASVQPDYIERAVGSILHEVERMRDELVGEAELDDCRTYLTGALPLELETNDGIVEFLLNIEQHGLGLDYLQRYPEIVGAVTREGIRQAVHKYLDPERYVLAIAGTLPG